MTALEGLAPTINAMLDELTKVENEAKGLNADDLADTVFLIDVLDLNVGRLRRVLANLRAEDQ